MSVKSDEMNGKDSKKNQLLTELDKVRVEIIRKGWLPELKRNAIKEVDAVMNIINDPSADIIKNFNTYLDTINTSLRKDRIEFYVKKNSLLSKLDSFRDEIFQKPWPYEIKLNAGKEIALFRAVVNGFNSEEMIKNYKFLEDHINKNIKHDLVQRYEGQFSETNKEVVNAKEHFPQAADITTRDPSKTSPVVAIKQPIASDNPAQLTIKSKVSDKTDNTLQPNNADSSRTTLQGKSAIQGRARAKTYAKENRNENIVNKSNGVSPGAGLKKGS